MAKAAKYETVAEGIRQEIQAGTYAGGVGLDVAELVAKYGTTQATVSRALALLGDDGLAVADGDVWNVIPADMEGSAGRDAAEPPAPVVTESAEEPAARTAAKAQAKAAELVVHTPQVLKGTRVVTEHVDPNAERALKRAGVAQAYQETKTLGRQWLDAEGRATEAKRAMSAKLMELRQMFTYRGDPDYNGQSSEYQALAALLYQDLGADKSAQRAILHHVEDRKREIIPPAKWDKFGVEPLTRGERAGLEKKAAKALTEVSDMAKATAVEARKGKATGAQLVTLATQIEHGVAVFSTASLRVMSPAQRKTFREQMQATRDQAEAALQELDSLDD
ncbi:GntR family transcriptional regulator [Streptomyces sp. NBC_01750]|uniref:GntR family transcriptional regulator n=1 Tax=Streptomyces sp. NBC_01750 TaxID=2975928 RepID=UPI002DD814AD|nr:GntR family transcriptional regulator [Streptomyces sp. NBC_01750]WSD31476.1 GntR family transcriptional regulator [Streptomyces sp. NBC_01750]